MQQGINGASLSEGSPGIDIPRSGVPVRSLLRKSKNTSYQSLEYTQPYPLYYLQRGCAYEVEMKNLAKRHVRSVFFGIKSY